MARPRKTGLDYFSVDTAFEENMETLIAACGNDGLAFMIRWWQPAYANGTGEVNLSDSLSCARLAERLRVKVQRLIEIAGMAARLGLVDPERWEKDRVLTSNGVRRRLEFIQAERDRKRPLKPSPDGDSSGGFGGQNPRYNPRRNEGKESTAKQRIGTSEVQELRVREASAGGSQPRARSGGGMTAVGEVLRSAMARTKS